MKLLWLKVSSELAIRPSGSVFMFLRPRQKTKNVRQNFSRAANPHKTHEKSRNRHKIVRQIWPRAGAAAKKGQTHKSHTVFKNSDEKADSRRQLDSNSTTRLQQEARSHKPPPSQFRRLYVSTSAFKRRSTTTSPCSDTRPYIEPHLLRRHRFVEYFQEVQSSICSLLVNKGRQVGITRCSSVSSII